MVGAGGVLVEIMRDRSVGLPPIDSSGAHHMLDRLGVRPLLDGVRGSAKTDIDAVARAVMSVSVLAAELGGAIEALDVNPLRCGPTGAVALDALVVASGPEKIEPRRSGSNAGSEGELSGILSGKGRAIGSGASRLRPSASNRSSPRSVMSVTSVEPVGQMSAAARATAGPHIIPCPPAEATTAPFAPPTTRSVADDREMVRGEVDRGGPDSP